MRLATVRSPGGQERAVEVRGELARRTVSLPVNGFARIRLRLSRHPATPGVLVRGTTGGLPLVDAIRVR